MGGLVGEPIAEGLSLITLPLISQPPSNFIIFGIRGWRFEY